MPLWKGLFLWTTRRHKSLKNSSFPGGWRWSARPSFIINNIKHNKHRTSKASTSTTEESSWNVSPQELADRVGPSGHPSFATDSICFATYVDRKKLQVWRPRIEDNNHHHRRRHHHQSSWSIQQATTDNRHLEVTMFAHCQLVVFGICCWKPVLPFSYCVLSVHCYSTNDTRKKTMIVIGSKQSRRVTIGRTGLQFVMERIVPGSSGIFTTGEERRKRQKRRR